MILVLILLSGCRGDVQPPPDDELPCTPKEGRCSSVAQPYGQPVEGDPLLLDWVRPHPLPDDPLPVAVFVHGGGWSTGNRTSFSTFSRNIADAGFPAVTIDYRLAPEFPQPASIHDVKAAVRWVRGHAADLGADPNAIVVVGASAGSHLAGVLGVTNHDPAFEGDTVAIDGANDSSVQLVMGLSPSLDFVYQCVWMFEGTGPPFDEGPWETPTAETTCVDGPTGPDCIYPTGLALWTGCECTGIWLDNELVYPACDDALLASLSPAVLASTQPLEALVPQHLFAASPDFDDPDCTDAVDYHTFVSTCGGDLFRSDRHAELMADALTARGIDHSVHLYPGEGHGFHDSPTYGPEMLQELIVLLDGLR